MELKRRTVLARGLMALGAALVGRLPGASAQGAAGERPADRQRQARVGRPGARVYDAVVVGAGAMGGWTAFYLRQDGLRVLLVDTYGPGNSRASSGGESRAIRAGYGTRAIYTTWATEALAEWKKWQVRWNRTLFIPTGVLWLARDEKGVERDSYEELKRQHVPAEWLASAEITRRFPQIACDDIRFGLFERDGGALLARQACEVVAEQFVRAGGEFRVALAAPAARAGGNLASVQLSSGGDVSAAHVVFACGPWLPKIFESDFAPAMKITRQEVYFIGPPPGSDLFSSPKMPVWIDLGSPENFYGIPAIDNRGFKIAADRRGPPADPDSLDRTPTPSQKEAALRYAARRFPALRRQPIVETRVCQYENSADENFFLDRHPELSNVWILGGGSGHGFKHGPKIGSYVAGKITGRDRTPVDATFRLSPRIHR